MSRKFKRFVSLCLAMVVVLNTMLVAYAQPNSARDSEGISDAEIMSEINRYMEKQNLEYELKNQIHTYTIPLSNGEVAFVTHELKKVLVNLKMQWWLNWANGILYLNIKLQERAQLK